MKEGVDDHLAQDGEGDAPDILAVDPREVGGPHGVFFQEEQDALHRLGERLMQLRVIENVRFIGAGEASALDPSVGKMGDAIFAKEQDLS